MSNTWQSNPSNSPNNNYLDIILKNVDLADETTDESIRIRQNEKGSLQNLNKRLLNYIEQIHFLNAQNQQQSELVDNLQSNMQGGIDDVKEAYEGEIGDMRTKIETLTSDNCKLLNELSANESEINSIKNKNEELKNGLNNCQHKINEYIDKLTKLDSQLNKSSEVHRNLQDGHRRLSTDHSKALEELNNAKSEIQELYSQKSASEIRRKSVMEEMAFSKTVHDKEISGLRSVVSRDKTPENREYWNKQLASALDEIQNMHNAKLKTISDTLERQYGGKLKDLQKENREYEKCNDKQKQDVRQMKNEISSGKDKVSDLETRTNQLKNEISKLENKIQENKQDFNKELEQVESDNHVLKEQIKKLLMDLEKLTDIKLCLELEIAAYRKLLEGEENRLGIREMVESFVNTERTKISQRDNKKSQSLSRNRPGSGNFSFDNQRSKTERSSSKDYRVSATVSGSNPTDATIKVNQVVKGELSAKTTYHRTAKGHIAITDCSLSGNYIAIENTGNNEENIGGWTIVRQVDYNEEISYTIPVSHTLPSGTQMKVFCRSANNHNFTIHDLEAQSVLDWKKPSIEAKTVLRNSYGEERATHEQKTIYN